MNGDGHLDLITGHYWPGDILAFRSASGELRVHRLIGYRRMGGRRLLQMRADATGTLDLPIEPQRVIGKVVGTPQPYTVPAAQRVSALARFMRLRLREMLGR